MVAPLSVVGITRYHRPVEAYTTLRNDFIRDARVSLRAFRVGAYVLSHATGFVQTQRQIAHACGLSVTTVRAALEDLRRDRHLVSRRIREGGRWIGTAYAVSDVPFTEEELALLCPPGAESECSESARTGSAPPKKTTPVRETMKDKKTNPPGGAADADLPEAQEDEPMPRTTASVEPALFDLPEPVEVMVTAGRQGGKSASQRIVAAFVDSHREQHGVDPTRAEIGRVARDVKHLLGNPSSEDQLMHAATAMGKTPFANIAVQLKKARHPVAQMHRQQRHGADVWEAGAAEIERRAAQRAAEDPAAAAWLAGEAVSA